MPCRSFCARLKFKLTHYLLFAIVASCLAVPLCIFVAFRFTKPHPQWYVRGVWILFLTLAVAFLNYSIAIAGCVLAIR